MIDRNHSLPLARQAALLQLGRSSLYYEPCPVSAADLAIMRRIVVALRAVNPRVFGSVARGEDTEESDLDLLVEAVDGTSLFDIAAMELEALLGCPVYVTADGGLRGALRVLADAEPV